MSAPRRSDLVGRWVPEGGPPRAYIELREDGDLAGHDGCNRFGGQQWSFDGDRVVTTGARFSTMMACPDVDTWLADAESFTWDDGHLRALSADGSALGLLLTDPDR